MQTEKATKATEKVVNHADRMLGEGVPPEVVGALWCTCGGHLYSTSTMRWVDVHATPTVVKIQKRRRIVHQNPGELDCMKGRGPSFEAP